VAAHAWATWHQIIFLSTCHMSKFHWPTCLPSQHAFHVIFPNQLTCHLPCVRPYPITSAFTDYTINNFFACLENRIERDISLIRCLFEPFKCLGFMMTMDTHLFCFESIPNTFIFGLNFDPWSRV
jgi:hypothetical protein